MSKVHQGGWVASFVIIGAVLVFGLIGSVYALRQQSTSQAEVATTDTDSSSTPSSEVKVDDVPVEEKPEEKPEAKPEEKPEVKPEVTTDKPDETNDTPEKNDTTTPAPSTTQEPVESDELSTTGMSTDTDNEALPTTGPSEMIGSIVALSALSFSSVGYLQSRRHNG